MSLKKDPATLVSLYKAYNNISSQKSKKETKNLDIYNLEDVPDGYSICKLETAVGH